MHTKIMKFFEKEKNTSYVMALVIAVIVITFFLLAKARANGYLLTSGDTAVAEQALWNTVHGNWFYQSSLIGVSNNFREHLNFVQFLFLPFYAIAPNLLTLYAVINLSYAIAAFVFFQFARKKVGDLASFALALFFLLQPIAIIQNIDAMHVVTVGAPLLLLSLIFYEQKNFKLWLVFMLATCFVTEFIAPTIFIFGLLALWDRRSAKWVVPPMIASVFMYALSASYITIGYAKNSSILNSFTKVDHLGLRESRVKQFLSPALYFAPFFSKYAIFLIPTVLVDIYVADINRLYPGSHLLSLVPAILTITIFDVLQKNKEKILVQRAVLAIMLVGVVYSSSVWIKMSDTTPNKRTQTMNEAVSWVKDNASVTTARIMGIALNHRKDFYLLDNLKLSDYMVIDKNTGEYSNPDRAAFFAQVETSGNYLKVFEKDNIVVYVSKERAAILLHETVSQIDSSDPQKVVKEISQID